MKSIFNLGLEFIKKYKQFVLYSIIGTFSASLDFAIYTALFKFSGIAYLISNAISVNCGIITSFLLNRQFNFKIKDKTILRFVLFYSVGLLGLAVSTALLWMLVEHWEVNAIVAKILTIIVVVLVQFSLNKYITFKNSN